MSTTSIAKALTVFQGIGNRDEDLAVKYIHPTNFTQHNPLVSDGVDGVKEWIRRLPREKSPLKTVRAFQEGSYVIANTEGDILGQNVFFDIFRLEDDLIVEQWTFSTKAAPPNKSGHTQTDGPTEAKHEQDTEKNKSIVRDYYETVHLAGDHDKIPQYSTDDCIRHEPGVSDGLGTFLRDLKAATEHGKASRSIDEIKLLLGQGDFVFVAAKGTVKGAPCAYIDLYRVEGDKMAEHWGFHKEIPPPEQRRNTNGVL
jgi:predicted SnoaL-like aldol condensation-catalyzing enzyme